MHVQLNFKGMKNLKNLMLAALVLLVGLCTACDNEDANPDILNEVAAEAETTELDSAAFGSSQMEEWTVLAADDLPPAVVDYVSENYPSETITKAWLDENGGYVVLLRNRTALRFDNAGNHTETIEEAGRRKRRPELTAIATEDLPEAISLYLADNYADFAIERAGTDAEGQYYVKLAEGPLVIFDAQGNFVEERSAQDKKRRRKRRAHDEDWEAIPTDSLPTAVLRYIAEHYPDNELVRAGTNREGQYGVVLDSAIALLFDADGHFIAARELGSHHSREWTAIDSESLPQNVLDYIATNYPDATIMRAGTNAAGEYGVILNEPTLALLFAADGSFIESQRYGHHGGDNCENEG